MNPKILFVFLLTTAALIAAGQDNNLLNQSDAKGLKQGHWIRKTPQGHIQYEGYFKDNLPVGQFKRYYENDSLSSVLVYSADSKSADATFYYQNGFIESKGKYVNQKKEGKWKFFSAVKADYLLCEEDYLHNLKNGLSVKYYPDKTPSEKLSYINDVKSGEWYQYFPNGQVCLKATYTDGQLNGKFTLYYDNGKPEFTGQYNNDSRDGNWIRYNIDGSLKKTISYVNGQITNPELNKEDTDYLDALEKNKGKIEDPEKTGTIFQQ
jgi:antitoxin component YwqK of YwqJK toxin-antitoxin module